MGTHGCAQRRPRRTAATGAGLALAAAIGLAPAVAAAAPADRGPITYAEGRELFAISEGGGESVPLGKGAEPAWSPSGKSLAYLTGPTGGPYDGVVVAEAGAPRPVVIVRGGEAVAVSKAGQETVVEDFGETGVTHRARLSGLAWSHDGQQVRLAVMRPRFTRLVGIDVETGAVEVLRGFRNPSGAVPRDIAWSPEGGLVAFSAVVRGSARRGCRAGGARIFTHRLERGAPYRLRLRKLGCGRERVGVRQPAFSPDGTELLMTRYIGGDGDEFRRTSLLRVDITPRGRDVGPVQDTGPQRKGVFWGAFSPDGQRIAYLFLRGSIEDLEGGVGVMEPDGTDPEELVNEPFLVPQHPDWGYAPRP